MPAPHQASKSLRQKTQLGHQNVQTAALSCLALTARSHHSCNNTYRANKPVRQAAYVSRPRLNGQQAHLSVNKMILSVSSLCSSSSFFKRFILWPPPAWLRTSPPSHFSPRPSTCKQLYSYTKPSDLSPHTVEQADLSYRSWVRECIHFPTTDEE